VEPHNPIPKYIGIFLVLTFVTCFEMLPLFGLLQLPPVVLLILSAVKFVAVCAFFMHLLGDAPIYTRLFFIPLGMVILTVMVLMTLFHSWTLSYKTTPRGSDSDEVAARYRGVYKGQCNAWVKSPFTGNEYCSSPWVGFATYLAPYEELSKPVAADPAFDGFDTKSPEEKQAILVKAGEAVYSANCVACHQATGQGLPNVFPPLAGDPKVNGPAEGHITTVLKGLSGQAINGVTYSAAMPPWAQLTDQQIASVITYERNSWGNSAGMVEPSQVSSLR
jgi:mono/diheme cytochrome c family protein